MDKKTNVKNNVQRFGRFLSAMVMPNIGMFIAWGFITALFIPDGYFPNENLSAMVDVLLKYLLPTLIAYSGGKLVGGERGAVIGAIATAGVIAGADIPMLMGAMIMGPFAGWVIKKFDKAVDNKIPSGFEMLVNNFSVGIIGMLLAILGYYGIGPLLAALTAIVEGGVDFLISKKLLPLVSIFVEPGKILFLNNAINHGIFTPIGANQVSEMGKSIMYLIEANPGPGLGILLAYFFFGKGDSKDSSAGAMIIHFFGGIHEIYFPYVLMNPYLLLAVIAGGFAGVLTNVLLNTGLRSAASPGSIIAIMSMAAPGDHIKIMISVLIATVVSFFIASIFVKRAFARGNSTDFEKAKADLASSKAESKGEEKVEVKVDSNQASTVKEAKDVKKVVFACDAGMGSSAMGASRFRNAIKDSPYDIEVTHASVSDIPEDADIIVTNENLVERVDKTKGYEIIPIKNFLADPNINNLIERFIK
ncbi:PTS mannitol transporter subunit IICB [uncultured Anaerococcus sp.]|uniref:PTS mannitol transporter subunit IICB n=1 Tax=uncultured Anaerococcus sp. TaxID=293428 RepID=UPI0026213379|nr:PTS mannitol transporter subunit IICBA [uncultured Anaerococcus sp.]